MQRTLIGELAKHVGETVAINGWVDVRRDQGKMVFFDFRDMTGLVQGVDFAEQAISAKWRCAVEQLSFDSGNRFQWASMKEFQYLTWITPKTLHAIRT